MNKKFLTFVLPIILGVMLVTAGVYYAMVSITINVNQPIEISGTLSQEVSCDAGETCDGDEVTVSNTGDSKREIVISDDSNENVSVSYIAGLELTEKTVDFSLDVWVIPEGAEKVQIEYALVDGEFSAEVVANEKVGYELIYYKDNSDRFVSPAQAIPIADVIGNLPYDTDKNSEVDGTYDYCLTTEYNTCHGAKIWYVPTDAINSIDKTLDWSRATEFYYESELVQFNSIGEITIYPASGVTFTPRFAVDMYAPTSTENIEITVA